MYDASKETDKEVLKEFTRYLQEELIFTRRSLAQALVEKTKDEQICEKLSEELFLIRKRIFDSKQEKKENKSKIQKKHRRKGKLPHNQSQNSEMGQESIALESVDIEYQLDDNKCPKCQGKSLSPMKNLFEESSEFEVVERRYILQRHKRQKYSCSCCKNIVTAEGGLKLTTGGEFSIQIATQIAGDKYEDHIPLERQRKQMERVGLSVEVKTLFGLTEHLYNRLNSLHELIRQDVLSEKWVHIDESPVDFYNPIKSKGFIWSMSNPRGAYYQFEPTRSGQVAREMLKGYTNGVVVTDGFSGYNFLEEEINIKHAFCWAHVRRKFFEAMNFSRKAEVMVDWIDELYDVEQQAETLEDLERLRQEKSYKIINKIEDWMKSIEGHYLESTSLGKAINYYLERKIGLHYFLHDKFVPLDNNMAERRQRCPVMGRKNYLHFKSINGADVGAFFYSVIESCKSNGLNARAYINEMAHRSAKGEVLESPYAYAIRLSEEIRLRVSQELAGLARRPPSI